MTRTMTRTFEKRLNARRWQKLAMLAPKIMKKGSRNHQNITKMDSQIDAKSMKNRGCVADAFLERFWAALGRQVGVRLLKSGSILRSFLVKNQKKASKKASKNQCRKSVENVWQKVLKRRPNLS